MPVISWKSTHFQNLKFHQLLLWSVEVKLPLKWHLILQQIQKDPSGKHFFLRLHVLFSIDNHLDVCFICFSWSGYQLVVVSNPELVIFQPNMLYGYQEAQEKAIPFYITAELSASQAQSNTRFTIGDGEIYDGYYNAPLAEDGDYAIVTGLVSTFNGVCVCYDFTEFSTNKNITF